MKKYKRLLIYTQDSYGLGHLRRTSHLANALVEQDEELTIMMVVDSPVAPFFPLKKRIDYVKLPTIIKIDAGVFKPDQLAVDYSEISKMRSEIICQLVSSFKPDVMLVDHMPGGANNELLPSLQLVRRENLKTRFLVGLRDIIDDPGVVCQLWDREGVYELIEEYYDAVLIYGSPDYFPTAEVYQLSDRVTKETVYCGYVCGKREYDGPINDKVVSVIAGGGSDGYNLMNVFLEFLETTDDPTPFYSNIVTGPFLPEDQVKNLRIRSDRLGVQLSQRISDPLSLIEQSACVISMAGYNTLGEILKSGKPSLIVPRSGPSAEQTMRAKIFAERGLIQMLEMKELTPKTLSDGIQKLLHGASKPSGNLIDMDGINRACEVILQRLC